mgnify:CR=1 FL=1|tara:strand:- start:24 stop:398 length:375 start_codon:yes stop_codon:yes gene_type:complete
MPNIVNKHATYEAVAPHLRNSIIDRINAGWRPRDNKGNITPKSLGTERWWDIGKTGHPKSTYPTRIYLLGNGTPLELHRKYNEEYPDDPMPYNQSEAKRLNKPQKHAFINYIRELIKQGIFRAL